MEENKVVIDRLIEGIKNKKNPCIVGIDPSGAKFQSATNQIQSPKQKQS